MWWSQGQNLYHHYKTCGGHKARTSTTIFKKYGIKTSSGRQECHIQKIHLGSLKRELLTIGKTTPPHAFTTVKLQATSLAQTSSTCLRSAWKEGKDIVGRHRPLTPYSKWWWHYESFKNIQIHSHVTKAPTNVFWLYNTKLSVTETAINGETGAWIRQSLNNITPTTRLLQNKSIMAALWSQIYHRMGVKYTIQWEIKRQSKGS